MQLDKVVPFGRSLDEYRHLFALSPEDLDRHILGVADGPASVNAELHALDKNYCSVDPLYSFSAADIKARFHQVADDVFRQVEEAPGNWVWSYHRNLDALRQTRIQVMETFTADFPAGKQAGRYLAGELPHLEFADNSFDLALCSHFLFLYSAHLSYEFHRDSVLELLRVAREIRIFPLLTLTLDMSSYLKPLIEELSAASWQVSIEVVPYEFQKGGNQMLKIGKLAG